jgi:hypothetical protein
VLSVREGRVAGRVRTDAARITTANAAATPRPPRNGDDRIRTGGLSRDKRALCAPELRPRQKEVAPAGVEPASRAHEARGTAVSPRRIWLAGVEPALSGSRNRRDDRLPYSQSKYPRRDSNPRFRAENPASLPLDHGGVDRRSWSRTRPCSVSASRAATDTDLRSSGGRSRTCVSRSTVARLAVRPHRSEAEGEGVEPPTAEAAPVFETGYRACGSPSEAAPAGVEPAPCRLRVGSSPGLSYGAERCGRQASNLRRVAFQATALPH